MIEPQEIPIQVCAELHGIVGEPVHLLQLKLCAVIAAPNHPAASGPEICGKHADCLLSHPLFLLLEPMIDNVCKQS
ncbi:hypothetical protein D1872_332280 [compost metagenome]